SAGCAPWPRAVIGPPSDDDWIAAQQIGFWERTLDGAPEVLELPTDRPRPQNRSLHGGHVPFDIDGALRDRLASVASDNDVTMFMVMHAAYAVLLSRMSAQEDVVVGTPVFGRGDRTLDPLVGMLVNTLALRTSVAPGAGFTDLLGAVRDGDLAAFDHADVPFETVV